jgi:hypothetical protein
MSLQKPSPNFSVPQTDSPENSAGKRPASERRIQANRRNALRSTGPRTERGKRNVSRNAIKHGFLSREVVITAGDGEESLKEFHDLLEDLSEQHEPVGVVEEALVQTIASCWWRKARVIRAENGSICKRLYTVANNRERRNLDEHSGLAKLSAILLNAKCEIVTDGYMSEQTRIKIYSTFGPSDPFALTCSSVGPPEVGTQDQQSEKIVDQEANETKAASVVALIESYQKSIRTQQNSATARQKVERNNEARSFSLPPADVTDKLLRYEAHLDKQLYRAMDQLERLQRQRRGEAVPPPLNINLGRGR